MLTITLPIDDEEAAVFTALAREHGMDLGEFAAFLLMKNEGEQCAQPSSAVSQEAGGDVGMS